MKKVFFTLTILFIALLATAQTAENPFAKYGFKKVRAYSSSHGAFEEFHDNKEIVEIGSVLYNTKTNQIVGYVEEGIENDVDAATPAMSIDPLCEKYYWISPYAYCLNNPIRFIDPDGRDPGQYFSSIKAAAKDFGKYYNGSSIIRNKEFSSTIYYVQDKKGKVNYSYTVANMGSRDGATPSKPAKGQTAIANIHTHGAWLEEYVGMKYDSKGNIIEIDGNNNYNNNDKQYDYKTKTDGYLVSPDGSLQKYDVETTKVDPIDTNMPSDPNDPGRKNNINPVDNPNLKYVEEDINKNKK